MTELARNPYDAVIENAIELQGALQHICDDHVYAIEAKALAVRAAREAGETYSDMESEVSFEVMNSDEYAKGKNAEVRSCILDVALIKARQQGGPLHAVYHVKRRADEALMNADIAFQQSEAKFKAVRVAAELQAMMLRSGSM